MASLQGIDVSNWKDIDVTKAKDFVIVQTTWGAGGLNGTNLRNGVSTIADKQVTAALRAGKLMGFMHYPMNRGASKEAEFFRKNCLNYFGLGIPMIDWEAQDNSAVNDAAVFELYLIAFEKMQGGPGIAYFQASLYSKLAPVCKKRNWGIMVAQYATTDPTGIQEHPWNEGAYSCAIRQYSSAGEIGVGTHVDLDKFYGDKKAWMKYVKASVGGKTYSNVPAKKAPAKASASGRLVVDGSCGTATIKAWQRDRGTTVDGVISGQVKPVGFSRPALPTACVTYGGTGSELIRRVQQDVKKMGYYKGAIDGLLGPGTIEALHHSLGVATSAMKPWTSFGPGLVKTLQKDINSRIK
jgi:peptidoglycan hydrolase-like protein with peptidoglycan-binding domain